MNRWTKYSLDQSLVTNEIGGLQIRSLEQAHNFSISNQKSLEPGTHEQAVHGQRTSLAEFARDQLIFNGPSPVQFKNFSISIEPLGLRANRVCSGDP